MIISINVYVSQEILGCLDIPPLAAAFFLQQPA